jgi:hypothetical protein
MFPLSLKQISHRNFIVFRPKTVTDSYYQIASIYLGQNPLRSFVGETFFSVGFL